MNIKLLAPILALLAAAIGLAVVFGPLGAGAGTTNRTKLEARLHSTCTDPLASGKTKWEQRFEVNETTLERQRTSTEVEDVSTIGAHEILLNGVSTTPATFVEVDALGFGDLNLDSRDGDDVLDINMAIGDSIEVLNPDGIVILVGEIVDKDGPESPSTGCTPEATGTPDGTGTPDATHTPDATGTPDATETPEATHTPESTATP